MYLSYEPAASEGGKRRIVARIEEHVSFITQGALIRTSMRAIVT